MASSGDRCEYAASMPSMASSCSRRLPWQLPRVYRRRGVDPALPRTQLIELFFGCALVLGILTTLPIGGADMPVVIAIYNAFTDSLLGSRDSFCRYRR